MGVIGRTLSHYRIVESLGAGGMGEVYRARDEKLGRDVAVKVLPADSLSDETARRRFQKEAEALVRLSHPHIATLFDVDSADGTDFIVMEVVPGPTLKERLQEGPLREKEVVRLGTQLVRGLMAAHEKGIVHRDLKPSNLSLTADGLLKILDFGLVRLAQAESGGGETAPTETAAGRAAGTLPYMSPEQLRGRGVDARSDLYAVGAVLFELATGRRVFEQANEVELADAILHETPPSPRSHKSTLSPGLEAIVLKALDKDPDLRYQTAREMLVDLERLQVGSTAGSGDMPVPAPGSRRRKPALLTSLAVAAATAAVAVWLLWPPAPPRITEITPVTRDLGPPPEAGQGYVSWATDGVRLYWLADQGGEAVLMQRPISGGESITLKLPFPREARIEGYLKNESALLMRGDSATGDETRTDDPWSPRLWIVPVPAGGARPIGDLRGSEAAASPDERWIAVTQGRRILIGRMDGTGQRELLKLEWGRPFELRWSPDGQRLRFRAGDPTHDPEKGRWLWEVSTGEGSAQAQPLWPGLGGDWSVDGQHFVFPRWDPSSGRHDLYATRENRWPPWSRAPVRLTSGPIGFRLVGADPNGSRFFALGETRRGELLRLDRDSGRFERFLGGDSVFYAQASPDGERWTWVSYPDGRLWRGRVDGTERLQLTGPRLEVHLPCWSPDGRQIAFAGRVSGGTSACRIYVVPADGGNPEALTDPGYWDPHFLPDGSLIFSRQLGEAGIQRLDLRTRESSLVPGSEGMYWPKSSPAGHILATEFTAPPAQTLRYKVLLSDSDSWQDAGPLTMVYPTWTADGTGFCGIAWQGNRIDCYSLATHRLEPLVDLNGLRLASWVQVPWMGLAPDDSPLVVADRGSRDLYALEFEAP